jgi:eukaryotic-like serine/threonine-protein kinase
MQHPHLAVIHVMESWRGTPVLILEYLAGGTLAARIRQGPIPIDDVLAMSVTMAEVLRHVHAAGYLHRDVKPSNIGYTNDGSPKLLDFGLAQMIADVSEESSTQSVKTTVSESHLPTVDAPVEFSAGRHLIGTPAYMSPEVVTGGPITPAIDLWSLAVTMYEALTETQPFRAPKIADTINLILAGEIKDARVFRSDCPASIAEFLALALARSRYHRPQTAVEFLNRLTAARAALPLNATV